MTAIQAQMFSENPSFALGNSQDFSMGFNNLFSAPSQPQQLIQLDQFQNPKRIQFHHQHHHHNHPTISQTVSAEIERQRLELEQFINLQNERLRMAMQAERMQQMAILMKKYEQKTEFLLKQKEEEIKKAANRNMELQNFLKRMEMENQTWKTMATENETAILSLNSWIQRLREAEHLSEDAESCCQKVEESGRMAKKMICRCCDSRNSCVVMLPCRHLCSCKDCEVFLDSCPVCSMEKTGTIEALI